MKKFNVVSGSESSNGKTRWTTHGILIIRDDGKIRIKLDSFPIGDWDGWFGVYEQEPKLPSVPSDLDKGPPF